MFRTFMSEFEADIAKAALEAFEIDWMLIRDDCGGQRPHLTMGAGIPLVIRSDAKRAKDALAGEAEKST